MAPDVLQERMPQKLELFDVLLVLMLVWVQIAKILLYVIWSQESEVSSYVKLLFYSPTVLFPVIAFWHKRRIFRWNLFWVKCAIIPVFTLGVYAVHFLLHGFSRALFQYFPQYIVLVMPAYCSGVLIAYYRRELKALLVLEKISWFVLVYVGMYIKAAFFTPTAPFEGALGRYSYMAVSLVLLPFFAANFILYIQSLDENLWVRIRRLGITVILFFCLCVAGTRSIVIIAIFSPIILIILEVKVCPQQLKRLIVLQVLFLLIFFSGEGKEGGFARFSRGGDYLLSVLRGNFSSSSGVAVFAVNDNGEIYKKALSDQAVVSPPASDDLSVGTSVNVKQREIPADRVKIYKLACNEIKNNLPWGMGALGFISKYVLYPHQFGLELLSDCGILGGLMLLWCIYLLGHILLKGIACFQRSLFLSFGLFFALYVCVSGSYWSSYYLHFFLGYGAGLLSVSRRKKIIDS